MKTRAALAVIATLTAALTACGNAVLDKQAECQKALSSTASQFEATETNRPSGCEDLSREDYEALLRAWALKNGVTDREGDTDPKAML
ncbi:hypothetical protein [Streptomyces sp. NPDC006552]|uniref:hypothetical protein n=1 Tax=Streptomyces sp. NPDC006552 TaxID=3157179 RepID=UPI0033B77224